MLNALRDKATGRLNLWKAEKWEEQYQHGRLQLNSKVSCQMKTAQRSPKGSWTFLIATCLWCVPVPMGTALGDGFSIEPQHNLPGLKSISDLAMQNWRSSKGKTKVVQITQIGNGGSHRFLLRCSVFTCMFSCLRVVVVSLNESSGCLF